MAEEETIETQVLRQEPTPLRMTKRRTWKEDGRYLLYYEFEQGDEPAPKSGKEQGR